jgi:hypothetical protein
MQGVSGTPNTGATLTTLCAVVARVTRGAALKQPFPPCENARIDQIAARSSAACTRSQPRILWRAGVCLLASALALACADDKDNAGETGSKAGTSSGGNTPIGSTGKSSVADIARKLGREPSFLIGIGNNSADGERLQHHWPG